MTRVALLPSSYLPALGGVEEMTRHLALALRAAGDAVEVWTGTPDAADPPSSEELDGLQVRRFPLPLPSARVAAAVRFPAGAIRSLASLRRAVAAFAPDVLHVHCFGPNGVYATALARITGVPLVLTLHGETVMDDHDIFDHSAVLRASLRWGLRRAGTVTGCSRFTLADAEARFGLPPGRGIVVPNGVVLDDATPVGPGWSGAPGRPYVLALGRAVDKKGFDLLLAAYAAIEPASRSADLVIGGDGPALDRLRAAATDLGVAGHVHFPGRLTRDEVAAAMAGAEMLVVPSRVEPFGIVILEGWRAATPVVATVHGGPPDLIHDDEDGVLVDPFDTRGFAAVMAGLLDDPARRRRLGEGGRDRVAAFDWTTVATSYREVYDGLTGAGDRTRAVRSPEIR